MKKRAEALIRAGKIRCTCEKGEVHLRMKQKDKFRYAERCLYEYKRNLACLEILREDLRVANASLDVRAQNYQYTQSFSGEPSNPVQARVQHIELIESRIKKLERWTMPITRMLRDLNSTEALDGSRNKDMLEVLRLMYFGNNQPDVVIDELKIGRRTFFRRRRDLVYETISYLGI